MFGVASRRGTAKSIDSFNQMSVQLAK